MPIPGVMLTSVIPASAKVFAAGNPHAKNTTPLDDDDCEELLSVEADEGGVTIVDFIPCFSAAFPNMFAIVLVFTDALGALDASSAIARRIVCVNGSQPLL